MILVAWCLFLILTAKYIIMPVKEYVKRNDREIFDSEYRLFKLHAVKKRYKVIRNLKNSEIEELFDLDSIYNNIH